MSLCKQAAERIRTLIEALEDAIDGAKDGMLARNALAAALDIEKVSTQTDLAKGEKLASDCGVYYIASEEATRIRIYETEDGQWEIDAGNEHGNYSRTSWVEYEGKPMGKEEAIHRAAEFAAALGRQDLAGHIYVKAGPDWIKQP